MYLLDGLTLLKSADRSPDLALLVLVVAREHASCSCISQEPSLNWLQLPSAAAIDPNLWLQDGGQLKPSKTGIMLNPVEWEHLADALPDLQAALGVQNTNFQVRSHHLPLP